MKKTLMGAIASLLLSMGAVSYAQAPPAQPEKQQDESSQIVLRGCLTKGAQPQQYMVADEETGKKVAFGGSSKLDNYVNQTVELSGRIVERGGERTFQPEAVKSLSASCKDSKKQQ